jgi:hypothetical protein
MRIERVSEGSFDGRAPVMGVGPKEQIALIIETPGAGHAGVQEGKMP